MSQEHPPPDGVPTHGPAPGPSLLSTTSASATTTAPSTVPISVPAPADMLGTPSTPDTTITTSTDRRRATPGEIDNWARTIYNYHRMHMHLPTFSPTPPNPSDLEEEDGSEPTRIIFTLCSLDLRVAHYAAYLFLTTFLPPSPPPSSITTSSSSFSNKAQAQARSQPNSSPPPPRKAYQYLLFSGHSGLLTRSLTGDPCPFSSTSTPSSSSSSDDDDTRPQPQTAEEDKKYFQSEATIFASIALSMGVPPSAILIEEQSTNTGENVRFTHALLEKRGIKVSEVLLVQKPYMERRTWGTFGRQWPSSFCSSSVEVKEEERVNYSVTSPPLEWEEYPDEESGNGRELVINVMVGDLVRIKEYGEKGWQVKMEIPENVWEAGRRLVEEGGYGGHLAEGFRFI
ncbi:hypothetical protein GE21DRAFT_6420 [Neurospora crassa]|uniref:DUF218 domain-containing protein n=1 Tax=Neurospora crassa (strain ATCC 24698 / 74-OR23-1A / CBS 708.71 / DSM 1257 / FGSC 987) TaxID=367110 RepID=Q7S946_NEUCR|nr:hypothetical protein NCU07270 [Neurospora crassa OR74A]EAA32888.1 hypothetical protein NCU07270 [Neurospora crassa OR74A]KHE88692.1 hypothetical protein GE21DRAFT_6420 [Neurospora crassa]|eukprot:XP_962124.1 hypothetical protein NCU07270 [Neurospora crassa OR74A]